MAGDGDKELVIRIRREVDPGGEAAARAAYAEERKQLDESVKASQKASRARAEAKKAENDRLKALDKERDDQVKRSAKEQADAVKRSEKDKAEFIKEQEKVKQRAAADTAAKVAAQAKATAQAQATAAKQAAAATAQAMAQQTKATKEAEAAASQMTKALLGSQAVGAVLRQVEAAIQSVAASSMAAGEHIQNMAQKAADMRHADREILALTGKPITARRRRPTHVRRPAPVFPSRTGVRGTWHSRPRPANSSATPTLIPRPANKGTSWPRCPSQRPSP